MSKKKKKSEKKAKSPAPKNEITVDPQKAPAKANPAITPPLKNMSHGDSAHPIEILPEMSPTQKVRAAVRNLELKKGKKLSLVALYAMRDEIGLATGMKPDNVKLYLRLLNTPPIVQDLVAKKWLPMADAVKTELLKDPYKEALAGRLIGVESPEQAIAIVREIVPAPKPREPHLVYRAAYRKLITCLERVLPILHPPGAELPLAPKKDQRILEWAARVIGRMAVAAASGEQQKNLEKLMEEMAKSLEEAMKPEPEQNQP